MIRAARGAERKKGVQSGSYTEDKENRHREAQRGLKENQKQSVRNGMKIACRKFLWNKAHRSAQMRTDGGLVAGQEGAVPPGTKFVFDLDWIKPIGQSIAWKGLLHANFLA